MAWLRPVEGMLDSSQQKQSVPATQEPVLDDFSLMLTSRLMDVAVAT